MVSHANVAHTNRFGTERINLIGLAKGSPAATAEG